MGEHGGRYLHFPHYLKDSVENVYVADHRGHGRSEGTRGHADRFDDLVDDAAVAIRRLDEKLKKKYGKSEIHLFGHSLGGHLAIRVAALHPTLPLASVTISAPFLAIKAKVPIGKKLAAKGLSKLWPSLQLDTQLSANQISHDPAVVEAYTKDRLVHSKMTPAFFETLNKAFADTLKRGPEKGGIGFPVQFLVPLKDSIVDANVSLEFFKSIELRDKRLKTYPEFFHEPFNEIGKEEAFSDLTSWIDSHAK
jgi:alpha-beta hydrolase superfamily lysophospholipase